MKNKKGKRKISKKKEFIRTILYFIIGLVALLIVLLALVCKLIKSIVLLTSKAFEIMPKYVRGSIILALTIYSIFATLGVNNKVLVKEYKEPIIKINMIDNVKAEKEVKTPICSLSRIECKIYTEGTKQGLNDKQNKIALSISRWETGNWTSSLYKNHNFGGIYANGHFKTYTSEDEGIQDFIKILKLGYFDKGRDTLEKIQVNYCPVGAKNDPTGLNNHWLKGTNKFLEEYENIEVIKWEV